MKHREAYLSGWSGRFSDFIITVEAKNKQEAIEKIASFGYTVKSKKHIVPSALVFASGPEIRAVKNVKQRPWGECKPCKWEEV